MKKNNFKIKNTLIRYTLLSTATYIVYFMLMFLLGFAGIPELRFLNYILFFFIAYAALTDLVFVKNYNLKYLEGMAFTFILGASSFLLFGLFVLLFSLFNSFFIDIVGREMQSASQLGIWGPAFIVFAEGLGISSVVSLCMMQYFQGFSSPYIQFNKYSKKLFNKNKVKIGKLAGSKGSREVYS